MEHKIGMKCVDALLKARWGRAFGAQLTPIEQAEIIERESGVMELIAALSELREATVNLADFVVPLPVHKSHLIYQSIAAARKAGEVLAKFEENEG